MADQLKKTSERMLPHNIENLTEYLLYLRLNFAYESMTERFPPNSIILDAGGGEGYGATIISKKAKKVIALDVDEVAVEHGKEKYGSDKIEFVSYDGQKLPFEDGTFDGASSIHVIEHIAADDNYVSEVHRALKEGARFIVSTPNKKHRLKEGQKPWNRFHTQEYNTIELQSLLEKHFSKVEMWGIFGNPQITKIEIERLLQVQKIVAADRFNLARLIPESLKPKVISIAKKIIKNEQDSYDHGNFQDKYSMDDYHLEDQDVDECLDFFAIAEK
jgi:ubiquinone/menaquinone biosynthesis C-methylase UbiE